MANYKKIYTLTTKHRCCNENNILITDTARTFIGYYNMISDWLNEFLISDYMNLSDDCPKNGYIRTDILFRIQYVDVYGDVIYTNGSHKFLKNEWNDFNSDKEILDLLKCWIRDVDYNTNRSRIQCLKDSMYDKLASQD